MNLKTNYQYTYFIYPFAINEEEYEKYVSNLIKNKNYEIKFFDSFKDIDLYKYFVPSVKENVFQDFSFNLDKIKVLEKMSMNQRINILKKQKCLIFEYNYNNTVQGKLEEKDGIFFEIPKIELICFNTGICFLLVKTHLLETTKFSDILNFNYKFENIKLEKKNIKKLENIKIQTNMFNNMNEISEVLEEITGKKLENRKLDIDENLFLVYTYACIDAENWNKDEHFENIQNEFIKLAEVKPNDINVNVDYEKLTLLSDSSYRKIRASHKSVAAICSSADKENYTRFADEYENQYLYTYIIALHQTYYLKKLNKDFEKMPKKTIERFIKFNNDIWINEITTNSIGKKLYKRCKEKCNLEELFNDVKTKYDIYYKKLNIEKNKKLEIIKILLLIVFCIIGFANLSYNIFLN